jgi:DNA-binding transcriptional ArsR family regulator
MKSIYKVELTKIKGMGEFSCPVCRSTISPDDVEEKTYKILEVRGEGEILDEIIIQCNKCQATISVTGFEELDSMNKVKTKKPKPKGKTDKQILQLLEDGSSLTLKEIADVLEKKPKIVYKALRKLFDKGLIENNPVTKTYMLSKE